MKKKTFNDTYRLTQAVLDGRKTQFREVIRHPTLCDGTIVAGFYVCKNHEGICTNICMHDEDGFPVENGELLPRYNVGEVIAVAQSYEEAGFFPDESLSSLHDTEGIRADKTRGWRNKMLVSAGYMPHHIQITDVRIQRLQDISDEDCLSEGVITRWHAPCCIRYYYITYPEPGTAYDVYSSAKEAYAALIDKVSGKGTWDRNPWVFVYEFKLIKDMKGDKQ